MKLGFQMLFVFTLFAVVGTVGIQFYNSPDKETLWDIFVNRKMPKGNQFEKFDWSKPIEFKMDPLIWNKDLGLNSGLLPSGQFNFSDHGVSDGPIEPQRSERRITRPQFQWPERQTIPSNDRGPRYNPFAK